MTAVGSSTQKDWLPAAGQPARWGSREFQHAVLAWFDRHGRHDLPWQRPATPYRVWVSEIMLQQTQVATVIPYFRRFMERFPDVATLAGASVDEVLAHWAGLGYYARGRNLHAAARVMVESHGGEVPADRDACARLPGIGPSTAGAIVSLGHGVPAPILDGNVKRVLARFHAVEGWPGRSAVLKRLWALAEEYTPADTRCAQYNQAMMDLGATVCVPRGPDCQACPLRSGCRAFHLGAPEAFPAPKPRRSLPVRETLMLMLDCGGELFLERRPPTGIWGGLWSLPECEPDADVVDQCRSKWGMDVESVQELDGWRHTFSHYHLDIRPVLVAVRPAADTAMEGGDTLWYKAGSPLRHGLAAPVKRLLARWNEGGSNGANG